MGTGDRGSAIGGGALRDKHRLYTSSWTKFCSFSEASAPGIRQEQTKGGAVQAGTGVNNLRSEALHYAWPYIQLGLY